MSYSFWIIFIVLIIFLLSLDLFFHRKHHILKLKEALISSAIWILLAFGFNLFIYFAMGKVAAINFLTGYLVEKSLSIDNLFVFLLIFHSFKPPASSFHKVLFYGVLGAIVTRALFILAGLALLQAFSWVIYIFGIFLVITGIRIGFKKKKIDPEKNPILRFCRRFLPMTDSYGDNRFFIWRDSRLYFTPLFIVLLAIETTDIIFATDSIPAIFAITCDPFIVFTSNVFAIIGLRSLFFVIAGMLELFGRLHYGIALILVFIGCKMLVSKFIEISPLITLGIVVIILAFSIGLSIIDAKKKQL